MSSALSDQIFKLQGFIVLDGPPERNCKIIEIVHLLFLDQTFACEVHIEGLGEVRVLVSGLRPSRRSLCCHKYLKKWREVSWLQG